MNASTPFHAGQTVWFSTDQRNPRFIQRLKATVVQSTKGHRVLVVIAADQPKAGSRVTIGSELLTPVNPFL